MIWLFWLGEVAGSAEDGDVLDTGTAWPESPSAESCSAISFSGMADLEFLRAKKDLLCLMGASFWLPGVFPALVV